MSEGESPLSEVGSVLQEYTELAPVKKKTAEFGSVTVYDDNSRLYEFSGSRNLSVFLTPDGVEKMKSLPRSTVRRIHKSGVLGRGRAVDKGRSMIKEYGTLEIEEKTSKGGGNKQERNRRLLEVISMQELGKQIEQAQTEGELRLEVPTYYGYASWKTPAGKHRQALFMESLKEPNLADVDFEKAMEIFPDLNSVLAQARSAGVRFSDTTAGNIFFREEGDVRTYIIIDQA